MAGLGNVQLSCLTSIVSTEHFKPGDVVHQRDSASQTASEIMVGLIGDRLIARKIQYRVNFLLPVTGEGYI